MRSTHKSRCSFFFLWAEALASLIRLEISYKKFTPIGPGEALSCRKGGGREVSSLLRGFHAVGLVINKVFTVMCN